MIWDEILAKFNIDMFLIVKEYANRYLLLIKVIFHLPDKGFIEVAYKPNRYVKKCPKCNKGYKELP